MPSLDKTHRRLFFASKKSAAAQSLNSGFCLMDSDFWHDIGCNLPGASSVILIA